MLQEAAPPVPPTRPYTVQGDKRLCFPHFRHMKQNYTGNQQQPLITTAFYFYTNMFNFGKNNLL